MATIARRLYKVDEAAELLSLGRTTLYQLIARKSLKSVKIGKATRIPDWALDEFLEVLSRETGE